MYFQHIAIFLLLLGAINAQIENITIDYYENLILENIANARTFNMATRNTQFEQGAASQTIEDQPNDFDYVIVGAGTAGNVLVARLSENPNITIAVIEAGGEENDFSKIPNMNVPLQFSNMSWQYYTTPQNNCCLGMVDKKCMYPTGRVIGGESAIGVGIYRRSSRENYNDWSTKGFSYDEAKPFYLRSENSQINGDSGYHRKGGLLNVEYPKPASPYRPTVIRGGAELNLPVVDYNGRRSVGVARVQLNIKRGQKQSTGSAFLDYARARETVVVITNALVTKIIIDEDKTAQGVLYVRNNKKFRLKAKEVIVTGGAINTAQLLMLSGIGPKDHLNDKQIKVIQDSPVGKILKDKIIFPVVVRTNTTATDGISTDIKKAIREYLHGYGPLVKPLYVDQLIFIPTKDAPKDTPMFECLVVPPGRTQSPLLQRMFNYNNDVAQKLLGKINVSTDFALDLVLLRPLSAGSVTLKTSDPIDHPNINVNYFSNSKDVQYYIDVFEFLKNLVKTNAFRKINASLVQFELCTEHERDSYDYNDCLVRTLAISANEPSETTPMGTDRKVSVVDKEARVYGVKRLRVVGPGVFSSHISEQADVIMLAERMAARMKNETL